MESSSLGSESVLLSATDHFIYSPRIKSLAGGYLVSTELIESTNTNWEMME